MRTSSSAAQSAPATTAPSHSRRMKIFVFDLLAYGEHLDQLKVGNELPYPLSSVHFRPDVAVRTYAEHLDA